MDKKRKIKNLLRTFIRWYVEEVYIVLYFHQKLIPTDEHFYIDRDLGI